MKYLLLIIPLHLGCSPDSHSRTDPAELGKVRRPGKNDNAIPAFCAWENHCGGDNSCVNATCIQSSYIADCNEHPNPNLCYPVAKVEGALNGDGDVLDDDIIWKFLNFVARGPESILGNYISQARARLNEARSFVDSKDWNWIFNKAVDLNRSSIEQTNAHTLLHALENVNGPRGTDVVTSMNSCVMAFESLLTLNTQGCLALLPAVRSCLDMVLRTSGNAYDGSGPGILASLDSYRMQEGATGHATQIDTAWYRVIFGVIETAVSMGCALPGQSASGLPGVSTTPGMLNATFGRDIMPLAVTESRVTQGAGTNDARAVSECSLQQGANRAFRQMAADLDQTIDSIHGLDLRNPLSNLKVRHPYASAEYPAQILLSELASQLIQIMDAGIINNVYEDDFRQKEEFRLGLSEALEHVDKQVLGSIEKTDFGPEDLERLVSFAVLNNELPAELQRVPRVVLRRMWLRAQNRDRARFLSGGACAVFGTTGLVLMPFFPPAGIAFTLGGAVSCLNAVGQSVDAWKDTDFLYRDAYTMHFMDIEHALEDSGRLDALSRQKLAQAIDVVVNATGAGAFGLSAATNSLRLVQNLSKTASGLPEPTIIPASVPLADSWVGGVLRAARDSEKARLGALIGLTGTTIKCLGEFP